MKLVYAVFLTMAHSMAANTGLYPGLNAGVQNRVDMMNAPIQGIGGQRTYLQQGIPLNAPGINQIGSLPAVQTKNLVNTQLSGLQGNGPSIQQMQFGPQRSDMVLDNQGFKNPGAHLNPGTLPFQNNKPMNPAYNSQANLGQVAQSLLNQLNLARQLGNIGGGIPASVGTTPNNLIGLKANFGSIPINGLSAAIQQKQLALTQMLSRAQNLQGLNGNAGNALLQTQLTGVPNLSNQLNKSQFNQIAMNSLLDLSTPFNNIRNRNTEQIIPNLNIKMLPNLSANTNLMRNIGQFQANVASNIMNQQLAKLSNPTALSNIINQLTRGNLNSPFSKMFELVNKKVADFFNRLIKQVHNVAQIINETLSKAIKQLDKALLPNSAIAIGNYRNHTTPNFMNVSLSLTNIYSSFVEKFNKGFTTALNILNKQKRNVDNFPFDNWYSSLETAQLLPIFGSLEKLGRVIAKSISLSSNLTANNGIPHPISSNSSDFKTNSILTNNENTTANSTSFKNLTENSAILSDDGTNLKDYLVKINSTQDILSKWDAVVKDKVKGTKLNLASYAKRSPFCTCDGVVLCNCCLTLDMAVIKKEVCLEATAPKPGKDSEVSIIMDNLRQNITETNGENKQVKFDLEGLANGDLEIASRLSANTTQQDFCVSASLNLLGLTFSSIPLGCFSPMNQSISISN